jgi:hypothetical protein
MTNVNSATTPDPAGNVPAATALTPDEMVTQLRAMRDQIPKFTQFTVSDVRSLVPAANVDRDFLLGSIHLTGATPIMEQIVGVPQDELRQEAADHDAWTAVEDELSGLLKGVAAANLARRHRLGKAALLAYGASQMMVRNPEFANLIPHVEELKRLRRLGPRKKTGQQPQTPSNAPATPQQTTPPMPS